jgi:cation:H+ antiporter
MLAINAFWFGVSCLFLIISGGLLVRSLGKIARFLHISEFSAAFIIMALATSLPELFVGISAAMQGNPTLSLGNVIGANILNLTLITGIIVLVSKEIKTDKKIEKDSYFMLWGIILIIVLYIIGDVLSRIDGIILLAFFGINFYRTFKKRKKYTKKMEDGTERKKHFIYLLIFILAFIGLFLSSHFSVKCAKELAVDLALPEIIIGLFLLSIATTLPELVFGISAAKMHHNEMGVGDQIGTILANSALILGVVAIIHPIKVAAFLPFITSAIFMFIAAFIFTTFLITGRKLETLEGISLILVYVLFIIIEFFIK